MDKYPMMMYRAPGPHEVHGAMLDVRTVNSDAEGLGAFEEGWRETTPEAIDAYAAEQSAAAARRAEAANAEAMARANANAPDDAPPTRAELEVKARELGVKFTAKTTTADLTRAVAAAA